VECRVRKGMEWLSMWKYLGGFVSGTLVDRREGPKQLMLQCCDRWYLTGNSMVPICLCC
jgi:hypothetical protein